MQEPTPKQIHELDQILMTWKKTLPPMLKALYDGFIEAGFDRDQSLDLTKTMWIEFNKNFQPRFPKKEEE